MSDSFKGPLASRRQFLAGAATAGVGALAAGSAKAAGDPLITEV